MRTDAWLIGVQAQSDVATFCGIDPILLGGDTVGPREWLSAVLEMLAGRRTHSAGIRALLAKRDDPGALTLATGGAASGVALDSELTGALDLAWLRLSERVALAKTEVERAVSVLAEREPEIGALAQQLRVESENLILTAARPCSMDGMKQAIERLDKALALSGEAADLVAEADRSRAEHAARLLSLGHKAAARLVDALLAETPALRFRATVLMGSLADMILHGRHASLERVATGHFDNVPTPPAPADQSLLTPTPNFTGSLFAPWRLSPVSSNLLRELKKTGRPIYSLQGLRDIRIEAERLTANEHRDTLLAHARASEVGKIQHVLLAEALGIEGERYLFERGHLRFARALMSDAIGCNVAAGDHRDQPLLERHVALLVVCHAWPRLQSRSELVRELRREPSRALEWIEANQELPLLADAWVAEPVEVSRELLQSFRGSRSEFAGLLRLLAETLLRPGPLAGDPERTIQKILDLLEPSQPSPELKVALLRIGGELASPENGQIAPAARNEILRELHGIEPELLNIGTRGVPPGPEFADGIGTLIRRYLEVPDADQSPRLSVFQGTMSLYPKDRRSELRIPVVVQNAERAGVAREIDVRLQVDPESAASISRLQPQEQAVGTLEPGQKRELSFFCDLPESAGAAVANLAIRVEIRSNLRVLEHLKLDVGLRHIRRQGRGSPYQPGVALERGEGFVGRQRHLKVLADALLGDVAVRVPLVVGIRRVGKTSILHALRRDDRVQSRYATKYLSFEDCDDSHTTVQFLLKLASDMRKMLSESGVAGAESIPFSRETFRREPYAAFESFVQAVESLRPQRGLLLIMDEFDRLLDLLRAGRRRQPATGEPLGPDVVFQPETMGALRKMIMGCRSIRVVVAGLPRLRNMGYEERFFGMLEPVTVGGFNLEEAIQVIDVAKPVFSPTVGARDELLRASGGQPYLLQVICHELFGWMIHEGRDLATEQDVHDVLRQRILPQQAIFSDFIALLDERRLDLVRAIAKLHRESPWRRYVSVADIARELESVGRGDPTAVQMLLDEVMTDERPLVERAHNDVQRFRLTIGVLGDHLLR